MTDSIESPSTRPYLIRALYEWCVDCGLTPHLAVWVDQNVQVPREYVQNSQIVLNVAPDATSGLKMDNDWIEFKARFGGVPRDILVPVDRVMAIYARENGEGMAFAEADAMQAAAAAQTEGPEPADRPTVELITENGTLANQSDDTAPSDDSGPEKRPPAKRKGRPALKRIK